MTTRALIAAALYDFAGFLTTREGTMPVGSTHNAAPMAERLKEFLTLRDADIDKDPPIREWADRLRMEELTASINEANPTPLCFKEDLQHCINRWSKDNEYGMPDFALAVMVEQMLDAVGRANATTERFVGGSIAERVAAEYDPTHPLITFTVPDINLADPDSIVGFSLTKK